MFIGNYDGLKIRMFVLRGRAKITSHFPAGSFGRGLRCSLLTDPWAGYARRSRLAGGQNSRAVKYEFIFARPLMIALALTQRPISLGWRDELRAPRTGRYQYRDLVGL